MKAKLIKIDFQYFLNDSNDNLIATTENSPYKRLSMRNCQAIERGYDLDELAKNEFPYEFPYDLDGPLFETLGITEKAQKSILIGMLQGTLQRGFQKALELIGDNKFNKRDMISAYNDGKNSKESTKAEEFADFNFMQSLEKTEWDVEIEMFTEDALKSVSTDWGKLGKPTLDAEGCLILKRV